MRNKPILCVDFDGVIHSYSSPWVDETTIPDPPVPGALRWLWAATEWFNVQIYSSRSKTEAGRSAMRGWMAAHSVAEFGPDHPMCGHQDPDIPYPIDFASEKPAAFLTIDDRAICFEGDWSDLGRSPADLLDFKPWNKRPPPAKMSIDQLEDHINRNGSGSVQIRPDGTVRTRGLNAALAAAPPTPTFFELPDGKLVCCNPNGRWHGWLFHRHPDGQFVSEQKLKEVSPPFPAWMNPSAPPDRSEPSQSQSSP